MEKEMTKRLHAGKVIISPKLHDISLEIWNELLAYSKLYFDGKVSGVIEKGLELLKEDEARQKTEYENRLASVEDRMAKLEKAVYQDKEHELPEMPKTFG